MTKVLVLYYSSYGHTAAMADAAAQGAASAGAQATIRRVQETAPPELARKSGFRVNQAHAEAQPDELPDYDAIIVASPTQYGNMSSQMSAFWAQTVGIWKQKKLVGKIGGAMSSSSSQHGGNEAAILSIHKLLLHHGLIIVGLPYSFERQEDNVEVIGGSPYGATTIAGKDMSRQPGATELDGARFQGRWIAEVAMSLARGARSGTR